MSSGVNTVHLRDVRDSLRRYYRTFAALKQALKLSNDLHSPVVEQPSSARRLNASIRSSNDQTIRDLAIAAADSATRLSSQIMDLTQQGGHLPRTYKAAWASSLHDAATTLSVISTTHPDLAALRSNLGVLSRFAQQTYAQEES